MGPATTRSTRLLITVPNALPGRTGKDQQGLTQWPSSTEVKGWRGGPDDNIVETAASLQRTRVFVAATDGL